jgi:uncharacterized lipoprotein YmbA
MKWMMQTLMVFTTLFLVACSEPEPTCTQNCEQQDGSVYHSLEGSVDRSKSKEY